GASHPAGKIIVAGTCSLPGRLERNDTTTSRCGRTSSLTEALRARCPSPSVARGGSCTRSEADSLFTTATFHIPPKYSGAASVIVTDSVPSISALSGMLKGKATRSAPAGIVTVDGTPARSGRLDVNVTVTACVTGRP